MPTRVATSALVVVVLGSLLHFLWEWTGRSPMVAVFAATNESTWEHLKLAFWPALGLAPVQWVVYGKPPGWVLATAVRTLAPPVLIVVLFYGYTSLLEANHLVLDIGTFIVAVVAGETAGHELMDRLVGPRTRVAAGVLIGVGVVAFSTLTFRPPPCFLFDDPGPVAEDAHNLTPPATTGGPP